MIHVPPLRERLEDIPLLVNHFLHLVCEHQKMPEPQLKKDAIEALQKLPWRGNIRELSNMVERLVILCGNTITKEDVARYANS